MNSTNYSFRIVRPIEDDGKNLTKLVNMRNSIFLAGPCPRKDYSDDWRFEAFEILNELGFTGTVVTPTNHNYNRMTTEFGLSKIDALKEQTSWERKAMNMASAIVFWIPRSEKKPARTTNIEFGEWYKRDGIFVGWPDGAIHNEYISLKLEEQKKSFYTTLRDVLEAAVNHLNRTGTSYFTADTHFKQQRTFEYSRRPFADVNEMDLTMVSNWNKAVSMNDIVYHAGDFIDPEKIAFLKPLLENLNFKELHWTLGNYDRKIKSAIKNVIKQIDRPVFLYDTDNLCRVESPVTHNKYVIVHEPDDFSYDIHDDEIVLYGHIHGRAFAKRNGFDLAADYHRYTPISMEQVDWFANAMKFWDNNVYTDRVKTNTQN